MEQQVIIRKIIHILAFPIWIIVSNFDFTIPYLWVVGIIVCLSIDILLGFYTYKTKRSGPIIFGIVMTCFIMYMFIDISYKEYFTMILAIMSFSDGLASLIPTLLKKKFQIRVINSRINDKTYLGSAIFCSITFFILVMFNVNILSVIIYSVLLTLIEYFSTTKMYTIDDNLLIPLILLIFYNSIGL